MNTHPVRVGSCLFTMVDPVRGYEVDYNRWYERDHFYAGCMIGPGLFAGKRWVATRDLKDLRFPDPSPLAVPVDAGSYLAVYWVHAGHHDDHFGWAIDQVVELYKTGRGFEHRVHAHTALLHRPRPHYRDDDPVPIELALDHPYQGLAVVVVDPDGGADTGTLDAHLRAEALPALMGGSTIAAMVAWSYIAPAGDAADRAPMDLGTPAGPAERRVQMFFLDGDPAQAWPRFQDYAAGLAAAGCGRVVFAAPFRPTIVGTDTYTDQLW